MRSGRRASIWPAVKSLWDTLKRGDMGKYILGVDIGGTKIAAGIVTPSGTLKNSIVLPTFARKGIDASLGQVCLSIEGIIKSSKITARDIKGIGVCAPGPLDPIKGVVHNPPNLPGWHEVPLAKIIRNEFKIKTRVDNDANAAGMAETIWGAAKGYKNVFYVTVSTGIGTGIIIDKKIYHGKNGMAGEGGHVTINYDQKDAVCGCGLIGCIEALASGTWTAKRLITKLKKAPRTRTKIKDLVGGNLNKITLKTIDRAARAGDPLAAKTIKEQGRLLGIWLGSMINVLDPDIIVIGGGASFIGRPLFKAIKEAIGEHTVNVFARKTPVVPAKLKKNVGIFGAASILM